MIALLFSIAFALSPVKYQFPQIQPSVEQICTAENPDFVEYRYAEKIPYCARNVLPETKSGIYDTYQIPKEDRKDYTIDHIVPLAIGGSNSVKNLWPEHKEIKAMRRNLEMDLYVAMKNGKMTQEEAIKTVLSIKYKYIRYPLEK